jgi:hypothetical protein
MQFGRSWPGKVVKVIFLGTKNKTAPSRYPSPPPSCALWGRRGFFWLWRFCVLCFFSALAFARAFLASLCVLLRFPRSLARPLAAFFLSLFLFYTSTVFAIAEKKLLVSCACFRRCRTWFWCALVLRCVDFERLYFRCR